MTLVSQIITDAYRQSNLLALGVSPTTAQQEEALRYLNRVVKSVFGNEAGDPLTTLPIGRHNISKPAGYPWYDTVPDTTDWFVPKNTRVMLNVEEQIALYLHPSPDDGSRFAALDVSNNLSTYNVAVYGNGSLIEGATSIVLDSNGFNAEWFYREDLGTWVKYSPLSFFDIFPFPEGFDMFFITLLAMHLNPAYSATIDDQITVLFKRSQSQLRAKYSQTIPHQSEQALIRPAKMAADRDMWFNHYSNCQPNTMFDIG